jgi:hypothetical protein
MNFGFHLYFTYTKTLDNESHVTKFSVYQYDMLGEWKGKQFLAMQYLISRSFIYVK